MFQCPHGLELLRAAASAEGGYLQVFQCPHGLELLLQYLCDYYGADVVSMPSRAWIVTFQHFSGRLTSLCFNALTGLNCYYPWADADTADAGFNALTGLNCYTVPCAIYSLIPQFQCPHGLELLRDTVSGMPDGGLFQCPHGLELLLSTWLVRHWRLNVSMPSRAWIVTLATNGTLQFPELFQCPHGLELLRQECPIF